MPNRKKYMPLGELPETAFDATVASLATKWGMVGGAVTSAFGMLTSNGSVALIGIVLAILGFIINYTFQKRRECRELEEAELRRVLALAEESRRAEMHAAQLVALKDKRLL